MQLDRLTIMLPWPDKMLFPNRRRGSFRKFQPFIESARDIGYFTTKEALGRDIMALGPRIPLRITFGLPNRIRRDMDGLYGACKHFQDGIAQALGMDDSIFRPVTIDDCLDVEKRGFVKVEIGA